MGVDLDDPALCRSLLHPLRLASIAVSASELIVALNLSLLGLLDLADTEGARVRFFKGLFERILERVF